jgi:multidrug efflux pump subunit AcrA (membrane-fusion protein)
MATTVTVPTPTIHWLLYPLLVGGLLFGLYLWHDTEVKDAAAIQAVAAAKTSQTTVDKQADTATASAQALLQQQNSNLQAQLAAAKTIQQQVALVNKAAGINAQVQPNSQAQNPSSPATTIPFVPSIAITQPDFTKLANEAVDCEETKNQVAADQVQIAGDKNKLDAADSVVAADDKEITVLKGGSHLKRFLTATKHVLVGAGIGAAIGYAIAKK